MVGSSGKREGDSENADNGGGGRDNFRLKYKRRKFSVHPDFPRHCGTSLGTMKLELSNVARREDSFGCGGVVGMLSSRFSDTMGFVEFLGNQKYCGAVLPKCLIEHKLEEGLCNVAPRRSLAFVKHGVDGNACDLARTLNLPQLPTSLGMLNSVTVEPSSNVVCNKDDLGDESLESSDCVELPKCSGEAGLVEEPDCNVTRRGSVQLENDTFHGTWSGSSIVLALPHFSTPLKTPNYKSVELSNSSSSVACKEDSLRPENMEPFRYSDEAGSLESLKTQTYDNLKLSKCLGGDVVTEAPGNVPQRRSLQLAKDIVSGNECDLLKALVVHQLSRSSGTPNSDTMELSKNSTDVVCKEISSGVGTMEVLKCSDKVGTLESLGTLKLGNVVDESKLMVGSKSVPLEHSLQMAKYIVRSSGCDSSRALAQPQSVTKVKGEQVPRRYPTRRIISAIQNHSHHCGQEMTRVSKEESLTSITSSINKDLSEDQESQGKEIVTRLKVKETLRLFQTICRKLLQEEESKTKEPGQYNRVDLTALKLLKEKGKCLNTGKNPFGSIPGVEVGDEFHYKAELSIIGLHRNIMAGIAYVKYGGKYMAVSIVSSEGHSDIMDTSDVLLYSGTGGYSSYRPKHEYPEDQKLERGNLALKNNMDSQIPVRVIHGVKEHKTNDSRDTRTKGVATYIYDGLYLVENYWSETGSKGFSIFKFQLRRISGQPELAIREVKKSKGLKVRHGLCVEDISMGKEKKCLCVVNTIDSEHPTPFDYITKIIYPSWYEPTPPRGCDCTDGCSDSVKCACVVKNGGEIPFNYDGAIVEAKPLVYECGPSCKCPPSCHNRVSQHGIKFPLEIFKTKTRGWGVRSLSSIPSGSFICEYTGEMIEDSVADRRTNDEYLFDIGQNYNDESLWEGLSTCIPDLQQRASTESVEDAAFTVDASKYGNIGRFINHSCTPNLYAQNLLYDHDDKRMPHIMFFAAENITPLEELTYHYNYTIDQVRDSNGNIKKKNCYCGSIECTGRLY